LTGLNHPGTANAESAPAPDGMSRPATAVSTTLPSKAWAIDFYGRLPLTFELNRGQVNEQVEFLSRGDGYSLFLAGGEAVMVFHRGRLQREGKSRLGKSAETSVLRMQLVGANRTPRATGVDELPGRANYFIGKDETKWRTELPLFAKVKYENV